MSLLVSPCDTPFSRVCPLGFSFFLSFLLLFCLFFHSCSSLFFFALLLRSSSSLFFSALLPPKGDANRRGMRGMRTKAATRKEEGRTPLEAKQRRYNVMRTKAKGDANQRKRFSSLLCFALLCFVLFSLIRIPSHPFLVRHRIPSHPQKEKKGEAERRDRRLRKREFSLLPLFFPFFVSPSSLEKRRRHAKRKSAEARKKDGNPKGTREKKDEEKRGSHGLLLLHRLSYLILVIPRMVF